MKALRQPLQILSNAQQQTLGYRIIYMVRRHSRPVGALEPTLRTIKKAGYENRRKHQRLLTMDQPYRTVEQT
jgi:hypothetical protein